MAAVNLRRGAFLGLGGSLSSPFAPRYARRIFAIGRPLASSSTSLSM